MNIVLVSCNLVEHARLAEACTAYRAVETGRVFARRRPSLRGLLTNRHQHFASAHASLPSETVVRESVAATVPAWTQCEGLSVTSMGTSGLARPTPSRAPGPGGVPAAQRGVETVRGITFETPGIQHRRFEHVGTVARFVSNLLCVHDEAPDERVRCGDIHRHSMLSGGCGQPAVGYRFGRGVMDLDVAADTDHDTMEFFTPPSWQRRRMHLYYFDRLKAAAREFHDPGEYVTLFGDEWTTQPDVGGHINGYFDGVDDAELSDPMPPDSDTYETLFERRREYKDRDDRGAVVISHHTVAATLPVDFTTVEPDDAVAPLVEVDSQGGSSERPGRADNPPPMLIGEGEAGNPGH